MKLPKQQRELLVACLRVEELSRALSPVPRSKTRSLATLERNGLMRSYTTLVARVYCITDAGRKALEEVKP